MIKRKIPKKTIFYIIILVVLGIATYFMTEYGKSQKVTKILNDLAYKNINNVKVYGITKVEDKVTRIQGFKYFVKFNDNSTHKQCKGFVYKDFKRKLNKDIICKEKN